MSEEKNGPNNDMNLIKALFEAIKALQADGYELSRDDTFEEFSVISSDGKECKKRIIKFTLRKIFPLDAEHDKIRELILSCNHSGRADE
jgi:hypothetical protein